MHWWHWMKRRSNLIKRSFQKPNLVKVKVILSVFWVNKKKLFIPYLKKQQTINDYYNIVFKLSDKIKHKRPHTAKKEKIFQVKRQWQNTISPKVDFKKIIAKNSVLHLKLLLHSLVFWNLMIVSSSLIL